MKKILFFFTLAVACNIHEPALDGAYENVIGFNSSSSSTENDTSIRNIMIFKNDYWISTTFRQGSKGSILKCSGGTYKIMNGKCIQTFNFNSQDTAVIGKTYTFNYKLEDDKYLVEEFDNDNKYKRGVKYDRIVAKTSLNDQILEGVWKLQSRVGYRSSDEPQIKIYSYPRFAWIRYNVKQKKIIWAGGGTYQFDGDILIEKAEYFTGQDFIVGGDFEFDIKKISTNQFLQINSDAFYSEEVWNRIQ